MSAGVFVLDRSEILAAAAIPHRGGPLGRPGRAMLDPNYANVAVLELRGGKRAHPTPLDGWARLIRQTISTGHIPFLAAQVSKRRFHLTLADLPALGLQLLEGMESLDIADYAEAARTTDENSAAVGTAFRCRPSADRQGHRNRPGGKRTRGKRKRVRSNLPERPSGCFAQIGPDPSPTRSQLARSARKIGASRRSGL